MMQLWNKFVSEESGQGMVEYGLIIALVAVVVITALTTVGTSIQNKFNTIANALT